MSETRSVKAGTSGGVDINANMIHLGYEKSVKVTLSADYAMAHPPGFPTPPDMTGAAVAKLYYPRTLLSGVSVVLHKPEADALVAAGKASYA